MYFSLGEGHRTLNGCILYFSFQNMCYRCMVTGQDNVSEEINHSNLPIQFVLECEGLNE